MERRFGSQFVTCADDLVILWRRGKAEEALQRMRELMGKPKLTVALDRRHQHESKRRIVGRADAAIDELADYALQVTPSKVLLIHGHAKDRRQL